MYEDPTFATSASPIPRMKVNVNLNNKDKTFFTVDDWYSEEELQGVKVEIDFLTDFKKYQLDEHNTLKIDLDDSYSNKNISNILSYRYKDKLELFANQVDRSYPEGTAEEFLKCTKMKTSLRYFHQAMEFEEHSTDDKFVSYCFYWHTPQAFEGGEFYFEDVKVKSNQGRLIFFKGHFKRNVTKINFIDPKRTLGSGLFLITTSYN